MAGDASAGVTQLLEEIRRGDATAADRLFPIVYGELRRLAGHLFEGRRAGDTWQPTLLADDVFMKLVRKTDIPWENRAHFLAVAAKAMRELLIDHVRAKRARKRGGGWQRIDFEEQSKERAWAPLDLLALEEAMRRLGEVSPRQERVVELRFFAGLSIDEIAEVLGLSQRTVLYDWRMARAWLRAALDDEDQR